MKIEVTDVPNEHDDAFVASQLRAYNAAFTVGDFKLLRVFARDADGSIIGGLLADTYWQYLEVHVLWVSEAHRNAGHATRLLNAAESETRQRGCKHAFLDTFSFQSLGFFTSSAMASSAAWGSSAANMNGTICIKGSMKGTHSAGQPSRSCAGTLKHRSR